MRKLLTPDDRAIGRPAGPAQGDAVDPARLDGTLAAGLLQLRGELLADDELAQRVRHKYAIRNTNGYALSALLDAETPVGIFQKLMVGSEGTLAFLAEAVIDTIPAPASTTVTWIVLPSITEAAALVPGLVAQGAEAVELVLAPALAAAAQAFPGTPQYWRTLDPHLRNGPAPGHRLSLRIVRLPA
jgi:D-lactate dehydrogenase